MIPYARQSINDADIAAVVDVMQNDWLTQGPAVGEFEQALADVTGAQHAVAFSSGTAALHAAALAGGVGPGDVAATSTLSFVASANVGYYVGADVKLLDIDLSTYNLDRELVVEGIDCLVGVHYAGLPLDLAQLPVRPRVVIEDAAHALGALTPSGPVGNCADSDMCCFSFHPVKTVTTGEGGAVTTNDSDLAAALRVIRHHGVRPLGDPEQPWAYDITSIGFNYRITDMQCALGTSQLRRLELFIERRNEIAARYRNLLSDDSLIELPPAAPEGSRHAYHLFPVLVPNRAAVYKALRDSQIGVQVHYVPIHTLSAYRSGIRGSFPVADQVYGGLLSLPMFPDLTDSEQDRVVDVLRSAL